MAMVVRVKPEYNGKIAVQSSNSYNGLILSNNLSQATLVQIYNTEDELRDFLYTEYTTVGDSYAPSQIDPSLIHAYASEEITHNPTKKDYPANTVGKQLNEIGNKVSMIGVGTNKPSYVLDFSNAKSLNSMATITRNSLATYVDKTGTLRYSAPNTARFTHDPTTKESLGIYIEEERTNYAINSSQFNFSSTLTSDGNGYGPDKLLSSTKVKKNSNLTGIFDKTVNVPDGYVTRSIFVRPLNASECFFGFVGVGDTAGQNYGTVFFNVLTKTFSGNLNGLVDYGYEDWSDGYVRVFISCEKTPVKLIGARYLIGPGVDTPYDNACEIFGLQVEAGIGMSSYMPSGASTFTRNADKVINQKLQLKEVSIIIQGLTRRWEKSQNGIGRAISFVGNSAIGVMYNKVEIYDGVQPTSISAQVYKNSSVGVQLNPILKKIFYKDNIASSAINNFENMMNNDFSIGSYFGGANFINGTIKRIIIIPGIVSENEMKFLVSGESFFSPDSGTPVQYGFLADTAFIEKTTLLSMKSRQEFSIDGAGASQTRNIRRPFNFLFEIVDSSSVTITAQPASSCTAGTDNALTFTAPLGKTLTYAITPVYEN